ncbi:MAG: hypothetical protein ABN502_06340 [Gammaproteobacteria bacterium]
MKPSLIAQIAAPTEARRAPYVAWLLRLDPLRVFPAGPECNTEADQHLVDTVLAQLEELTEQAARSSDRSPRAVWFRRTLDHCNEVMGGKADPADNGWFDNKAGYRRGVYVFQEVGHDA